MSASRINNGFLADLEGLRAVAVLAVLIFHVDEHLLAGGFLGVDLFFVISGYVVSKVLIAGGVKGQLFDFYLNRFHRLIPATAVTILATIILFELFASQLTNSDFYLSALSSIFSLSNINFFLVSDYWSDELSVNPFLHFWSLSVEEQFYLIWPIILYVTVISRPKNALKALMALLLLSISLLYVIDNTDSSASFYLMPSRIFQFTAGALAFYLSGKIYHSYLRELSFIVGIISFIALVYLISGHNSSILISMIIPTFSSFLILFGLQTKSSNFSLSSFPFRYVGRISYSLYLVHWPIIILLKMNYGNTLIIQGSAIVLSFMCAYLLHENIEKKCRLHKVMGEEGRSCWPKRKSLINLGLLSSSIVVTCIGFYGATLIKNENVHQSKAEHSNVEVNTDSNYITSVHGIDARNISTTYRKFISPLWADRNRLGGGCTLAHKAPYSSFNFKECVSKNNEKKILIIGDSVTSEVDIILSQIFNKKNIIAIGASGCFPHYPEVDFAGRWDGCQELDRYRFDLIFREDILAIVIAGNWRYVWGSRVQSTIERLKSSGKPVIVIGSRPWFNTRISTVLDTKTGRLAADNLNHYLEYDPYALDEKLKKIIFKEDRKLTFIEIIDYLCPNKTCGAFTDEGALVYLDYFHITADAAISIGQKLKLDIGDKLQNLTGIQLKNNDIHDLKAKNSIIKINLEKDIWSCQTYEEGRLNGESKYKLSTDLNLDQCLEGESILLGDSWGPGAAEVLFAAYGANNVATLNSAGCRPLPPKRDSSKATDCDKMNALRFDMSLLSKYKRIFISSNWNTWSASNLHLLMDFFKNSNQRVYLFSPRPNFIAPVPSIINKNSTLDIDLSNYVKKPLEINMQFFQKSVSAEENIQVIDWYSPLTKNGKLMALTPEGKQIYRDASHLTSHGRKYLAEKLSDEITKIN
jgi:peptidoglycan/LPS O-acetylase OafA/YrhL